MGVFRQFPYSNFHEMNMDEIIKIMREMQDEWAATKNEWSDLKTFINNYFANLNLDEETEKALRKLIADGTLSGVINPVVISTTQQWLEENITPTTPVIDKTLKLADAAADSKVVGQKFTNVDYRLKLTDGYIPINEIGWEIGGINFTTSGWTYATNNNRVRTKEGNVYALKDGDIVGLTDYTNSAFIVGVHRSDGTWGFSGTQRSDYTCNATGNYAFVILNVPESAQENKFNLLDKFFIKTKSGNVAINSEDINRLEDLSDYTFIDDDNWEIGGINFTTSGWTYATNNNRVRTREGFSISLKAGDKIGLTDYTNSAFIVGIHYSDDSYGYSGTLRNEYICPADGDYAFVLREYPNDLNQLNNKYRLLTKLYIKQKYKDVPMLHIDRLEDLSDYTFIDDDNWEIGGINFTTSGWTYAPNNNRVRTKQGYFIPLEIGDKIGLTDYTNSAFILGVHRSDGTWGFSGTQRSDYTCSATGNYAFVLLSRPDEKPQPNKYDLSTKFFIKKKNSTLPITPWNKPILTIIDDDTISIEHIQKFRNACINNNIRGTFATITKYPRANSALLDLMKTYEKEGFQFVYHCDDQVDAYRGGGQRNMSIVENNFVTGLSWMHSQNFLNSDLWVTPYGVHDAEIQALAKRRGMKCLVSIAQNQYETVPVRNSKWFIPRIGLNQLDSQGPVTLAQLKTTMLDCANNNGWLLIGTHFDTWDPAIGYARFNEVIEYANELGFDIMTLGEAFDIWSGAYTAKELEL